jgi:LysM repeat protein
MRCGLGRDPVDHRAEAYGVTVKSLMAANPGVDPNRLKVGTVLRASLRGRESPAVQVGGL